MALDSTGSVVGRLGSRLIAWSVGQSVVRARLLDSLDRARWLVGGRVGGEIGSSVGIG